MVFELIELPNNESKIYNSETKENLTTAETIIDILNKLDVILDKFEKNTS